MTNLRITTVIVVLILMMTGQSCGQDNKQSEQIRTSEKESAPPKESLATANVDYDVYLELRKALLEIKPEDFGFTDSQTNTQLFGLVMDLNIQDSIKTISAFATGDVSVYNSTGRLYLAGVQVKRFRDMATDLILESEYLVQVKASSDFSDDLPKTGFVKFYLITKSGIQQYEYELSKLENQYPEWHATLNKGLKIDLAYQAAGKQ